jgi:hypothetical protein
MLEYIKPENLKPGQVLSYEVNVMVDSYGSISVSNYRFQDKIFIGSAMVSVTVPADFNPVVQAVAAIDNQLDTLAAKYHEEKAKLAEKKAQLLQITYGGAEILDARPDIIDSASTNEEVQAHLYKGNHEQR